MNLRNNKVERVKSPAGNMRFHAMAAVTPQAILCKIQRCYPAGTAVKPPLREAAGTLGDTRRVTPQKQTETQQERVKKQKERAIRKIVENNLLTSKKVEMMTSSKNLNRVMETRVHSKNEVSLKNQLNRIGIALFIAMFFCTNYMYSQTQNDDPKDGLSIKLDRSDRVNVGYIVSNDNDYTIKVKLEITVKLKNGQTKSVVVEDRIEKGKNVFFSAKIEKSDVISTETKYKLVEVKKVVVIKI